MSEPDNPNLDRLIDLATGAYARELEDEVTSHPATDALIAYQEGRLEASQAEELRRHLVACPLCDEALERLDAYDEDPDQDQIDASAASNAQQSWGNFRQSSASFAEQPATALAEKSTPAPLSSKGAWPAWALAASVLFALTGAGSLFLAYHQPNTRSGEAPATGGAPFVFDLLPDGQDEYRSRAGIEVVDVPSGMDPIVPRLMLGDQTAYSSYSAILTRVSGETVWRQSGFRRQPTGGFALLIPRAGIPPGDYVLRLLGEEPGVVRELASYTFRLRYPE